MRDLINRQDVLDEIVRFGTEEGSSAEFNKVISGMLIPELIRIADKYIIDRDSLIQFTANILSTMCVVGTFKNYREVQNED